jgi:SAM-dependent methyltransferase
MLAVDVWAFARANLPPPPARVLEVGAGSGELAAALTLAGYEMVAIDPEPSGENVTAVSLHELDEPAGSFDAAIAVVSLHHVEPLEESCLGLAQLIRPRGRLLVDEFDVAAFDERAATWLLDQWRMLGRPDERTSGELIGEMRSHLHPVERIVAALGPAFDLCSPVRGSYLYRWYLPDSLRGAEDALVAQGRLPAVGVRFVANRAG